MADRPQRTVEVTLRPPTSRFLDEVRRAARQAGAHFVRDAPEPDHADEDAPAPIVVLDLTEHPERVRLGRRVIAIGRGEDLDCYDVVPPDRVRARLPRVLRNLVERERLLARIRHEQRTVAILNELGYALSAPTSRARLLDTVLASAAEALRADAGSIYLLEGDHLHLAATRGETVPYRAARDTLPLDWSTLPGFVACNRAPFNIPDAYAIPEDAPYRPRFRFDRRTGYRTRSALYVPMLGRDDRVLGVLALVNRKRHPGRPIAGPGDVLPFDQDDEELARSIASQAAVALENYRLYDEIRRLFEGFVEAAVRAIEARDPSTGGHSHRVATLTVRLARAIDAVETGPLAEIHFDEAALVELHYAAMLHDFGKVGVREQVLLKAEKLYAWEMERIEARFRVAAMQVLLEAMENRAAAPETSRRLARLQDDLAFLRELNRPDHEPRPDDEARLDAIARAWNLDDLDEPILDDREKRRLRIPAGSLDPAERAEIRSHVEHTRRFLQAIPWTRDLARVPEIAAAHHEKLDGSGYPLGLRGEAIPVGARIMAVCDVFDALTAGDRPYKHGMLPQQALRIIRAEAEAGKLWAPAVRVFEDPAIWADVIDDAARRDRPAAPGFTGGGNRRAGG